MKNTLQNYKGTDRPEMFSEIEQCSITLDWILDDDETECPSHIGKMLDEASSKITANLKKIESEHAALVAVAEAAKELQKIMSNVMRTGIDKVYATDASIASSNTRQALANLAAVRGESGVKL